MAQEPTTAMLVNRVSYDRCPSCNTEMRPGSYKVTETRRTKVGKLKYQRIRCKQCGESCRLFTIGNTTMERTQLRHCSDV